MTAIRSTPASSTADTWRPWLRGWDAQLAALTEQRERVVEVVFDLLEHLAPPTMRVLDLAAGPGTLSQRLLDRFPDATSVAVDVDPVLLRLGQGVLGDQGGRLAWVQADLRDAAWVEQVTAAGAPAGRFDVVVSSTATHYLRPDELAGLYAGVAEVLRGGGVAINADEMPRRHGRSRSREAMNAVARQRQVRALETSHGESWATWWAALRAEPSLADAFAERDRILPAGTGDQQTPSSAAFHQAALVEAGFVEVVPVWQDLDDHVLLALR